MAIAILIGIAVYAALELKADFPGAKTIKTFRDEAKDAYQDVQKLDIPSAVNDFTDGTTEDQASDPAKRHLELKQHMLDLTNEHREKAGAPPVKLGSNPAAHSSTPKQSLEGCYSAHWDRMGSKAEPPIHTHGRHRCRWRKCQRFQTTASHHGRTTPR